MVVKNQNMRVSVVSVFLVWLGLLMTHYIPVFGQLVVNNAADSGPGTLRDAVATANTTPGAQTITFNLPNPSVIIIDNPITLTQGDGDGTLIDGDMDGDRLPDITLQSQIGDGNGLIIEGAGNEIRSLHFENFGGLGSSAILIQNASANANLILSCNIGTNLAADDKSSVAGNDRGISIVSGAFDNRIGDGTAEGRNVIGNNRIGIFISSSDGNLISGNIIGLDGSGLTGIANNGNGVDVSGSAGTVIGGINVSERNIISSNTGSGISLSNSPNTNIINNYIGTNINGIGDLGNLMTGITFRGSCDGSSVGNGTVQGINVISGNEQSGIEVGSSNIGILGNYIGLEADGNTVQGNTEHGIQLVTLISNVQIGDGTSVGRNIISGNTANGILIESGPHEILGNYIGLNSAGTEARGNGDAGIEVTGGPGMTIGGVMAGSGNVISGNNIGVTIRALDIVVLGNIIGLNSAGTGPIPNVTSGVVITIGASNIKIGDGTVQGANYISGNTEDGIFIFGDGVNDNAIDGNFIGTQIDGDSPAGNGNNGIRLELSTGNMVSGTTIAHNGQNGIEVVSGSDNVFTENSIFNNTEDGIRISTLPNPPTVDNVSVSGDISGNSDPGATVEIFFDAEDEGESYLATVVADSAGNWTYSANLQNIPPGLLNVTATQLSTGYTSEFSNPFSVPYDPFIVINTNDSGTGSLRWVMENCNLLSGLNTVIFDIPLSDPGYSNPGGNDRWTIQPLTLLPQITEPVVVDANTQPGTGNFRVAVDGQGTQSVGFDVGEGGGGSEFYGLYISGYTTGIDLSYTIGSGSIIGAPGTGNTIVICSGQGIMGSVAGGHTIQGNYIGTNENDSTGLGNGDGITISGGSSNNLIGGAGAGESNMIAYNSGFGINLADTLDEFNRFIQNVIYCNGDKGIDISPGNQNKIPPVIIDYDSGSVSGTGNDGDIIHVYRDTTGCVPLQGKEYLGSTTVSGGVWTLADTSIHSTDLLNATATDVNNNTSDFAINFAEIRVFRGSDVSGIQLFDSQPDTIDIGSTDQSLNLDQIFTIQNKSSDTLLIDSITVTGSAFLILDTVMRVGPNKTDNFAIQLPGTNPGVFNTTVTIYSNDSDEAGFDFPLKGEIIAGPEIEVFQGIDETGTAIIDGQITPVDFGMDSLGTDIDQVFTIKNSGTEVLNISDILVNGPDFSLITSVPDNIPPDSIENFTIRLSGDSSGTFLATVTINNDDPDESPFTFPLSGEILCREATLSAGIDQNICSGDTVFLEAGVSGLVNPIMWSTEGTGIFDNPTILSPLYFPGQEDINAGSVSLTITVQDSCSGNILSDEVQININPGGEVMDLEIIARIGEIVTSDVIQAAVFQAGDDLTVSIITEPVKGESQLQPDGTIDYMAAEGTIGSDSIGFRICNQCDLCDEGLIRITIANEPPVIEVPPDLFATEGGLLEIDLLSSIFDLNDNLDPSTLEILEQPVSGATASINSAGILSVDYRGVFFTGNDRISVQACDFSGECAISIIEILVEPQEIIVYNAVSPNGDGKHDFLEIENIEFYPDNRVAIFNRWGNVLFSIQGYNNQDKIFSGLSNQGNAEEMPDGTYYYSIDLNNGTSAYTGYLVIKRN